MPRTTIEISTETRDALREERLSHESNYDDTIERLLGRDGTPYVTEGDVREIVREELERIRP